MSNKIIVAICYLTVITSAIAQDVTLRLEEGHDTVIKRFVLSDDSRLLATQEQSRVIVRSVDGGFVIGKLEELAFEERILSFSRNGKYLLSIIPYRYFSFRNKTFKEAEGDCRLWDFRAGKLLDQGEIRDLANKYDINTNWNEATNTKKSFIYSRCNSRTDSMELVGSPISGDVRIYGFDSKKKKSYTGHAGFWGEFSINGNFIYRMPYQNTIKYAHANEMIVKNDSATVKQWTEVALPENWFHFYFDHSTLWVCEYIDLTRELKFYKYLRREKRYVEQFKILEVSKDSKVETSLNDIIIQQNFEFKFYSKESGVINKVISIPHNVTSRIITIQDGLIHYKTHDQSMVFDLTKSLMSENEDSDINKIREPSFYHPSLQKETISLFDSVILKSIPEKLWAEWYRVERISNNKELVIFSNGIGSFSIWNIKLSRMVANLPTGDDFIPMFTKDSKSVYFIDREQKLSLFKAKVTDSGLKELKMISEQCIPGSSQGIYFLMSNYDEDSERLYLLNKSGDFVCLDLSSGKYLHNESYADYFYCDSSLGIFFVSKGSVISVFDSKKFSKVFTIYLFGQDWLAIDSLGRFDFSNSTINSKLYFVSTDQKIEFEQIKHRFYEPGLLRKIMSREKLRNVGGMKSIDLPPDIRVGPVDEEGYLPIELSNKGGGIGEVAVHINGKEVIADARPKGVESKAPNLSFKVYVGNHKSLIKNSENYIAVKAWNAGHWVVSRGTIISYRPNGNESGHKPAIHIIACGVSDYTGTELDLKYAAKDAEDVSKALTLGAENLFGTDRSYIYNLTTDNAADKFPSKSNILKAFEEVSSTAHPLDIVVVYLSGHGINHGGQDGDWYYLTQDAYTASSTAYNDPEIRRNTTLSSVELVELFKTIPALKQVLMIDACASGKVVESLMAKKDIESSTLRALDRMRDRTGLHIITGCTADAVSYEASKYGQGVLTYSLLEGIRGAALREDQFVDINKLFQYSHDRVPLLAEGIGGIQTPQIFSPQGAQSFDIGQLDEGSKKAIPIAKIRPVYIRSTFLDDDQLEDALQLGKKIDDALSEAASKGANSNIIFVDVREYPEGCKLSGRYKQEKGIIKLKLRKKCEGNDETIVIEGKTVDEIKDKIIGKL